MCGIAGYVQRRESPDRPLAAMLNKIAHRGPDGSGAWESSRDDWSVSLGHRRLAIIDLAGGAQPMVDTTGRLHVTFNGEIYNYKSLRTGLERDGLRFASHSDTEAILNQHARHGTGGLLALNGMFAFALWDEPAGSLTLARDRAGIKPLYYAPLFGGGLAFSSELISLLQHPGVGRAIDAAGLTSLFFRDYAAAPTTLMKGVFKLEPGHFLVWRDGRASVPTPFWTLSSEPSREEASVEKLRAMLDDAVQSQLMSDVPLGVFLSGGIDSSLVAALAQRHMTEPLSTFSIGFEDAEFDESNYARIVATHIGSRHFERKLSEQDLLDALDPALDALDEPIADPSIVPTYVVSRLASEHVKVALGGDGGDELWGGYPTCRAHRAASKYAAVPAFVRNAFLSPLVDALPVRHGYQKLEWKLKRFVLRWRDDALERHQNWMSNVPADALSEILNEVGSPFRAMPEIMRGGRGPDLINEILAYDFSTYMSGSVLTKVDRASMAHGLEVRPPLLDNGLIDYAFSLPSSVKLKGKTSKWLLKQAAEPFLPPEIIHRPKRGFAIPLARWIVGPLRPRLEKIMAASPAWDLKLLKREVFTTWLKEHVERRADHSKPLWALLVLDHWLRRVQGT